MVIDNIEDKDLALAMLNDLKFTCQCLNQKILETSNLQLRQNYINILNETFNEHKQLFDLMTQRGWYQPMMAPPQQHNQIITKISNTQNEVMQTVNATGYQPQYQQPIMYQRGNQGHQLY
ncbi:spore coat protein [Peptococcaceae bacterium 1198_IL3148]